MGSVVTDVALFALGLLIGTFGTLIGAGGGFILVPLLVLFLHQSPATAVGTSLSLVCLNAASGSVAYFKQRRVDLSLGWKFAAATVPGAIGGAYVARSLSSYWFSIAFGVILMAIAILLFSGKTAAPSRRADLRRVVDVSGASHEYHVDAWKGVLVSFLVGLMSSILGIGGGIVHVPFLIVALSLPVHVATATSHFVLSISAFVGAVTFYALGNVNLWIVALMGPGILIGAQLGARASLKAGASTIRYILAASLGLVGLRMLLHAVRALG